MKFFHRVFGCSNREKAAEKLLKESRVAHEIANARMDEQLKLSRMAAAESRSAARTLLKRLSEDIPR